MTTIAKILENPEFWKQASLPPSPPTTAEQQQQVYLGLIDGFKSAGCHPVMVMGFLEAIMENSPMAKLGVGAPVVPTPVIPPITPPITPPVTPAAPAGESLWQQARELMEFNTKNPGVIQQGMTFFKNNPWAGPALKAVNDGSANGGGFWGGAENLIKTEAGPAWNYMKGHAAQWAPYAISGLGSMAAAKMMGAGNMTAMGAGLAGGYLGGRAYTGQPIMPPIEHAAGQAWDAGKDLVDKYVKPLLPNQAQTEQEKNQANATTVGAAANTATQQPDQ